MSSTNSNNDNKSGGMGCAAIVILTDIIGMCYYFFSDGHSGTPSSFMTDWFWAIILITLLVIVYFCIKQ